MTNLEQQIIEKIAAFPLEKKEKMLHYAQILETEEITLETRRKTIWETVKNIIEEVPPEAWDELPSDGSTNVDHYLYRHAKKTK